MNTAIISLILFNIWMPMSGIFSPIFLALGAFSSIFSAILFQYLNKRLEENKQKIFIKNVLKPAIVIYVIWVFKAILLSSMNILKNTWKIKIKTSPGFVQVKDIDGDIASMILAVSITATPGTACMPNNLVHCYGEADILDCKKNTTHAMIKAIAIKKGLQ